MRCDTATRAAKELEEQLIDLRRLDASESEPDVWDRVQKVGQKHGKRNGALQIPAVMANVDPSQHEFGMVARQHAGLEDDVPGGAGAARTARKPRGAE